MPRLTTLTLGAGALILVGLAVVARYQVPSTITIHEDALVHQAAITINGTASNHWLARIDNDLDDAPLAAWSLREDGSAGYHLHWQPSTLTLTLTRHAPSTLSGCPLDSGALVLAEHVLTQAPHTITWLRRGHHLSVRCDDEDLLQVDDACHAGATSAWSITTDGDSGDSHLGIYRAANHHDPASGTIADLRALLTTDNNEVDARNLRQRLMASNDPAVLAWLAWDDARHALSAPHAPGIDLDRALAALARLNTDTAPGLLRTLIPALVWQATTPPRGGAPAGEALSRRRHWLLLAADAGSNLGRNDDLEGRFLAHLCRRLAGEPGLPIAVQAPAWLQQRWRLSSILPNDDHLSTAIPSSGGPLHTTIVHLIHAADLDQPAAVTQANQARRALDGSRPEDQVPALSEASPRQAALLHAIFALNGLAPAADAHSALHTPLANDLCLRDSDPLAYALDSLLAHRLGQEDPSLNDLVPQALSRYRRLLSGRPSATLLVFAASDDSLPPLQALAAALAMQEVAGAEPDWAPLRRSPSLTLPLEYIAPPGVE
ncbi:MAG: hypothetical protein ACYTF0_02150 [Planctomycetota bacterium]|jgi:hypothetical protein